MKGTYAHQQQLLNEIERLRKEKEDLEARTINMFIAGLCISAGISIVMWIVLNGITV